MWLQTASNAYKWVCFNMVSFSFYTTPPKRETHKEKVVVFLLASLQHHKHRDTLLNTYRRNWGLLRLAPFRKNKEAKTKTFLAQAAEAGHAEAANELGPRAPAPSSGRRSGADQSGPKGVWTRQCGCGSKPSILVGEFTTHFTTYFSGDWDVHTIWILTHGHVTSGIFAELRAPSSA